MSNVFDQFDQKGANPFDQFDTPGGVPSSQGNGGAVPAPAIPWYDDLNAGIAHGASKIVRGVGTMLPDEIVAPLERHGIIPTQQDVAALDKMSDTPLGKVGSVGMDMTAVGALPLGAVAKGAEYIPALSKALQARGVAPAIARVADTAATQGAVGAAVTPDNRTEGAAWSAGGGAVGHALGRVAGGVVKPTAEAQTLMDAGVALTPGQAAGKGSRMGKVEEWAASNPVAGTFINPARQRAVKEFNLAVVNDALKGVEGHPIPQGTDPRQAVESASDFISQQYDRSLEQIKASPRDLHNALEHSMTFGANENPMVHPKDLKAVERYVTQRIAPLATPGPTGVLNKLTGEQLKQIDTEIGQYARQLARSSIASERVAAPVWYELQNGVRKVMEGGATTPEAYASLMAANNAYRKLLPMQKAVSTADIPNPRALRQAMLRYGQKPSDLVTAAEQTLPGTIPNSGTAERLIANSLPALLMGGGVGANAMGWDTLGTGMVTAGALGSRTGARAMTGGLPMQQALADALRRLTPATARSMTSE